MSFRSSQSGQTYPITGLSTLQLAGARGLGPGAFHRGSQSASLPTPNVPDGIRMWIDDECDYWLIDYTPSICSWRFCYINKTASVILNFQLDNTVSLWQDINYTDFMIVSFLTQKYLVEYMIKMFLWRQFYFGISKQNKNGGTGGFSDTATELCSLSA